MSVSLSGSIAIAGQYNGINYSSDGGVTWSKSITSNNFATNVEINHLSFSGSNGIAAGYGIYYTNNSGATWSLSDAVNEYYDSIFFSGSNGIAANNLGIYYTTDGGETWTLSTGSAGQTFYSLYLSGLNGIAGSNSSGIYYTIDGGENWTQSSTFNDKSIISVYLSGLIGIGGALVWGRYYTTDGGLTWLQSNVNSGTFSSVTLSSVSTINGLKGIAASGTGIWYTTDSGHNWLQSNKNTGNFYSVALAANLSSDGTSQNGIAGGLNTGIYYTTNGGQNWTLSNIISGTFYSFYLYSDGINGIAGSDDNGIFYTTNGGQDWTQSNINTGIFRAVSLSDANASTLTTGGGTIGIAANEEEIFYTSTPLCYEKNTLILVVENDFEIYKKICELKVGDTVKTYNNGYKQIKIIKSFKYRNFYKNSNLNCLYKMKEHDVILTGGHSILVDNLTEKERVNNIKYRFKQTIEDKKLLLACSSDKFEKLVDDLEYELWHFALENDDVKKHYGVYINDGILSESCSEAAILKML